MLSRYSLVEWTEERHKWKKNVSFVQLNIRTQSNKFNTSCLPQTVSPLIPLPSHFKWILVSFSTHLCGKCFIQLFLCCLLIHFLCSIVFFRFGAPFFSTLPFGSIIFISISGWFFFYLLVCLQKQTINQIWINLT